MGKHSDYKLNYFRSDKSLTKEFLLNIIRAKNVYNKFLPDNIKLENLSRDFMFSVSLNI